MRGTATILPVANLTVKKNTIKSATIKILIKQ
jgi:hypothetical protein